jgi:MHS family alpha-ketoglutarate permease-like MFS transporter
MSSETNSTAAPPVMSPGRRLVNILGGSGGNLVEWFDWFAYTAFLIYFAPIFFPGGSTTAQLLQGAAVFAVGFIARPLGAWLMGIYADKAGRKNALTLSVTLMCFGSLMIAVTPGHAAIGVAAPAILLIARVIQGLSVGGEYGASATYVSEMASKGHRGFWSGFLYVTLIAGQLMAVMLLVLLQNIMDPADLEAWGWRIPFFIGAALAVVVFWMRRDMHETASYTVAAADGTKDRGKTMLLFTKYPKETAIIVALTAAGGVGFYIFTTYMQNFLINSAAGPNGDGFSREAAAQIMTTVLFCFMCFQPLVGGLSDIIGRRIVLAGGFLLCALSVYPVYLGVLGATGNVEAILLCLIPLFFLTGYTSISAIFKAELFPAHVRALGVALPYGIAQAIFGGNAQLAALSFKQAGNEGGFFIALALLLGLGFVVSLIMGDTKKKSLILEE